MALQVEDGTGLADAESYLSIADADTYLTANKLATDTSLIAWNAAVEGTQEIWLRQATQYADARYDGNWRGYACTTTQALAWPRALAADNEGSYYDTDEVPQRLKDAIAELSLRLAGGDTLFADQTKPGTIKSKRIKAAVIDVAIEYQGGLNPTKKYPLVEALMRPLISVTSVLERG